MKAAMSTASAVTTRSEALRPYRPEYGGTGVEGWSSKQRCSSAATATLKSICFDENYQPSDSTRITTNFANLARGTSRQQNLRNTLRMIDRRFNELAHWDNPAGDRYAVELEIVSVEMSIDARNGKPFRKSIVPKSTTPIPWQGSSINRA